MATWVRTGTGTAPSVTDADLVGTYALGNATAPADFDGTAVTSVRCQWTITGSGFSDDSWNDDKGCALFTGTGELATFAGGGTTGNQNTSIGEDRTDATPGSGNTAAWESAAVRGDGTVIPDEWCTWVKVKGPDGSTLTISALTITITYTPTASDATASGTPTDQRDTATGTATSTDPVASASGTPTDQTDTASGSATSAEPTATASGTPTDVRDTATGSATSTEPVASASGTPTDQTDTASGSATSDTWVTFPDGTSASTGATVTGLTNGTAYEFRVAAVNSEGQGDWSNIAGPYTPASDEPTASGTPTDQRDTATGSATSTDPTATASGTPTDQRDTATGSATSTDPIATVSGTPTDERDTATGSPHRRTRSPRRPARRPTSGMPLQDRPRQLNRPPRRPVLRPTSGMPLQDRPRQLFRSPRHPVLRPTSGIRPLAQLRLPPSYRQHPGHPQINAIQLPAQRRRWHRPSPPREHQPISGTRRAA